MKKIRIALVMAILFSLSVQPGLVADTTAQAWTGVNSLTPGKNDFIACLIADIKMIPEAKKFASPGYQKLEKDLKFALIAMGPLPPEPHALALKLGATLGKYIGFEFVWWFGAVQDCWPKLQQPRTLFVKVRENTSRGTVSLNGIKITATVSGSAQGTINYTFYCDRADSGTNITSGWDAKFDGVSVVRKTATCVYTNPGTYTAKVIAERGIFQTEARTTVVMNSSDTAVTTNPSRAVMAKLDKMAAEKILLQSLQSNYVNWSTTTVHFDSQRGGYWDIFGRLNSSYAYLEDSGFVTVIVRGDLFTTAIVQFTEKAEPYLVKDVSGNVLGVVEAWPERVEVLQLSTEEFDFWYSCRGNCYTVRYTATYRQTPFGQAFDQAFNRNSKTIYKASARVTPVGKCWEVSTAIIRTDNSTICGD